MSNVVEYLTFAVEPEHRAAWAERELEVWSAFLRRQPGFIRKELWEPEHDPDHVHVVIWWESLHAWKAITAEQVAAVDREMGDLLVVPTCHSFNVLRES